MYQPTYNGQLPLQLGTVQMLVIPTLAYFGWKDRGKVVMFTSICVVLGCDGSQPLANAGKCMVS